eukprot:TRINITY_DN13814_c0_g1_i1.p1 TRINITY_DN13814_c0_g1~~TRINITY_DN13814_c0_g1_i1.p1  ORF type:complete len:114 (-),score=19.12 TRINITY_DN13814_c0_g1_i1:12-353(-)
MTERDRFGNLKKFWNTAAVPERSRRATNVKTGSRSISKGASAKKQSPVVRKVPTAKKPARGPLPKPPSSNYGTMDEALEGYETKQQQKKPQQTEKLETQQLSLIHISEPTRPY